MTAAWRYKDEVAHVAGEDRVAILDLDRPDELPVVLTDSAAAIWTTIDGSRDDHAIVAVLAERFAADPEEIGPQVFDFLQELAARGLIVHD